MGSQVPTLDFIDSDAGFDRQHYAFLVTETEFDEIFARIRGRNLPTGPMHHDPNRVNPWDYGHGVYFDDPAASGEIEEVPDLGHAGLGIGEMDALHA